MPRFKTWLESVERQLYFDFMRTPAVSPEQVKEMKLFGPVYHGTSEENRDIIKQIGFKVFRSGAGKSHGYSMDDYHMDIPPPQDHLGYGIYFTTVFNIAKQFNYGTSKGLVPYYIHAPKMEIINFGSPNTMMKWWKQNGYDMPSTSELRNARKTQGEIITIWQDSTENLTNNLKSKYDAVWFKGKSIRRLLDGDQVCVYDVDNIYRVDDSLSSGFDAGSGVKIKIGDRILVKGTNATAVIVDIRETKNADSSWQAIIGPSNYYLSVKNLKNHQSIAEKYIGPLQKEAAKDRKKILMISKNSNRSEQEAINYRVNYLLDPYTLKYNMPSGLVERVLKKGERLKR